MISYCLTKGTDQYQENFYHAPQDGASIVKIQTLRVASFAFFFLFFSCDHEAKDENPLHEEAETHEKNIIPVESSVKSIEHRLSTEGEYYLSVGYKRVPDLLNPHLKNLQASVNKDKGLLIIQFDYPDQFWGKYMPHSEKIMVRVFDKNKQKLTSFITEEEFLPENVARYWSENRDVDGLTGVGALTNPQSAYGYLVDGKRIIKKTENELQYPINQKDIEYMKSVEVGFYNKKIADPDSYHSYTEGLINEKQAKEKKKEADKDKRRKATAKKNKQKKEARQKEALEQRVKKEKSLKVKKKFEELYE